MYLQKGISIKNRIKIIFFGVFKVTDEKSRRSEDPDLHPDQYKNVMDPEHCPFLIVLVLKCLTQKRGVNIFFLQDKELHELHKTIENLRRQGSNLGLGKFAYFSPVSPVK
jgi:hypothetical protein